MSDQMSDYEQAGEFDHQGIDPADLGAHFTDAMQALTARNAVSKAACAQLIAEQAQRAEQAEAELAENEGVINVWRGRTERAEAERDLLRTALKEIRETRPESRRRSETCGMCDAQALTRLCLSR